MNSENSVSDRLPAIEAWTRFLFFVVATLAAAVYSVSHLTKFDAEQTLRSKLKGSTFLTVDADPPFTFQRDGQVFCEISGAYKVVNAGDFSFYADSVTFDLYELPLIRNLDADPDAVVSFALSERIEGASPYPAIRLGEPVKIEVGESFAPDNELQRSFGFVIPIDSTDDARVRRKDSNYVVVANTSARLDADTPKGCPLDTSEFDKRIGDNPGLCFFENDLQHFTRTLECKAQPMVLEG